MKIIHSMINFSLFFMYYKQTQHIYIEENIIFYFCNNKQAKKKLLIILLISLKDLSKHSLYFIKPFSAKILLNSSTLISVESPLISYNKYFTLFLFTNFAGPHLFPFFQKPKTYLFLLSEPL